jgi:arylsulfatase A-like enzyme
MRGEGRAMSERPNFLFIITDQQRADHLGCYGNRVVRTPVIDRLAATGSRFNRFYVASPSCQPNRASIMTGRMPSLHGVHHNGVPLAHEATTFVDLLRAAGYRTALLGKAHLQNFTGRPPVQRFAPAEGLQAPPPAMQDASKARRDGPDYEIENELAWTAPAMQRWRKPYYGFEHFEIASNHGDLVAGDYLLWARERRADFDTLRGREHAAGLSPSGAPQAWRTRIPEELYPTSYVAERTIAWLETHRREQQAAPFFIQMSFPDPHYPFTPPGR